MVFLCKSLCFYLIKKNYKVICLDNFIKSYFQNIKNLEKYKNFKFIQHNINQSLNLSIEN